MQTLQYSEAFYEFINNRVRLSQPDRQIAIDLSRLTWDQVEDEHPNFIDAEWDNGAQRAIFTYTTPSRAVRAGKNAFEKGGHRISTRPGRLVTSLLGETLDGHALDVFVQAANSFVKNQNGAEERIHVIKGDLIGKWYDSRMYCDCTGHGGLHSCMSYSGYDRLGTFDLYKDHCEMVVVLCGDCGFLQARAIVWTDRDNGNKFVDRIYGNNLNTKMLETWAANNGYYTVYGYQTVDTIPDHRIALINNCPENIYDRLPYIDSIAFCYNCNHGYFTTHDCENHGHDIIRPTFTWEHDRPLGPVRHTCADCGGPRVISEDSDPGESHGHEIMCENTRYCRFCDEAHCSERRCSEECETCGEQYATHYNGACDNSVYCNEHREYYCRGEDGDINCPYCETCETCETQYCGTCYTCNVRCCACNGLRPVYQLMCEFCNVVCGCGKITSRRDIGRNNGRCTECFAIVREDMHKAEADFTRAYMDAVYASMSHFDTSGDWRVRGCYQDYVSYFRYGTPFATIAYMFEATDWARRHTITQNIDLPTIVPIPLDVRAELIAQGIAL